MANVVCPRCGTRGPVRLLPGQDCAACLSEDAWERWGREGKLVIDRSAIAAYESRQRGTVVRKALGHSAAVASALLAAAFSALCIYLVARYIEPRAVGRPSALAEELRVSAMRLIICGIICLGVGLLSLRLPSPQRGRLALRTGSLAAAVAGGGTALFGAFASLFMGPLQGFEHLSMPAPSGISRSTAAGRVTNASAVVVAPDEDGDARSGAVGMGAVVAAEAGRALIVTCSHVAMPYAAVGAVRDPASARPVWIQLTDGREAPGRVVWTAEPPLDVALIEATFDQPPEPIALALATDEIDTDDAVFFVPNPYRKGFRVEHGKVLRREAHDTPAGRFSLLFSDLPLQPGDSGSGLFDAHGRLIGLNTWTSRGPFGHQGISLPAEAMAEIARAMPAKAERASGTTPSPSPPSRDPLLEVSP